MYFKVFTDRSLLNRLWHSEYVTFYKKGLESSCLSQHLFVAPYVYQRGDVVWNVSEQVPVSVVQLPTGLQNC